MADDGRAKRLKPSEDGTATIALQKRRIAELESEIAQLRSSGTLAANQEVAQLRGRNAELESEIEKLRSRGRREEGSHEVLPVVTEVVVTTAVDLSRLDTSLVNQISYFLGTARELLNLALTCKSFGHPTPLTALNWSLVEEVARQSVCSRATDAEMSFLPRYASGAATWLTILHRYEQPLMFNVLLGSYIEHRNGDKTKVYATGDVVISSAVSSRHVMSCGVHFAEFQITGTPHIGVVRPMPDLDANAYEGENEDFFFIGEQIFYPDFLAQRSDEWGDGNVHACRYCSSNGIMNFTDWNDDGFDIEWEGREGCWDGGTIGMLLNLDMGTLTVYKNNRRLGVMKDGLSGPYCWYVVVDGNDTVAIKEAEIP